jgi:hypothetical protein
LYIDPPLGARAQEHPHEVRLSFAPPEPEHRMPIVDRAETRVPEHVHREHAGHLGGEQGESSQAGLVAFAQMDFLRHHHTS